MSRVALSFVSLLAAVSLLACTDNEADPLPTPTPTQSIKVLEPIIAVATRTAPLPPTPTPAPPTSTPTLAETNNAALWIIISNRQQNGQLKVGVSPAFYEWAMHLFVLVEGEEYCNPDEVFDKDEYYEMACGALAMSHPSVEDVSVRSISHGPFRCERNFQSKDWHSIFACDPDR